MFQHAAARRRLAVVLKFIIKVLQCFNTQPPEGGWGIPRENLFDSEQFQHAAARRRLGLAPSLYGRGRAVSTRSRPKAAGFWIIRIIISNYSFNTQPPEGGWFGVFRCA